MNKCCAVCAATMVAMHVFADWTYDSSTKVLSEKVDSGTAWAFNCSASDMDLTLSSVKTQGLDADGNVKKLDLNTTIDGGYKIVAVASATSLFKQRKAGFATEIVLPKTLTAVSAWSFQQCYNPITIPEDNEIVTLDTSALTTSYLTGRVVFPKLTTMVGPSSWGVFNSCPYLYELELGGDCHTTQTSGHLAKGCSALTNFVCRADPMTITAWSLQNCSSLKTFTFYAKPTLGSSWDSGIKHGKDTRIFIKKSGTGWADVLSGSSFTAWENADQTTYFANFGDDAQIPLGYTTDPFAAYVLEVTEQQAEGASVKVTYFQEAIGNPSPAYGDYAGIAEATEFTVPQYSVDGTVLHESTGYDLATWDDANGEWVADGTTVAERSWTFTPVANEYKRITWNWHEAGYLVDVCGALADCSITTGNCELVEGYVKAGSTLTLTANGEDFSRWTGVPAGVDATQRTISFAVTEPLQLSAYHARDWQYDEVAKTISDGYWTINVTETNSTLKLNTFATTPGFAAVLDLDKNVSGGMKITGIAESTNLFKKRASGFASHIKLPKTLVNIENWAFQECYNPISIPEKNEIAALYNGTFKSSYLTGRVALPKVVTLQGDDKQGLLCYCDSLYELDIGSRCNKIVTSGLFASYCYHLTNLVCRADSITITGWSFGNCPTLKTFTFNAYPTLETNWAYGSSFGKDTRMFINALNSTWSALFEDSAYTPWENVSETDKTTYFTNFGDDAQEPLGYTTTPFKTWVLKSDLFKRAGLSVSVR